MVHHHSFELHSIGKYLCITGAIFLLGSCTYYVPAKLETARSGDTLTVAIAGPGAARWDPQHDSVVIECAACAASGSRIVEHFYASNETALRVPEASALTLTMSSLGETKTEHMEGTSTVTTGAEEMHLLRERHTRRGPRMEKTVPAPAPTAPEVVKTTKKISTVKVTATEGVAIYSDKTKTAVLKIVPQGTVLTLLAREGNLYSVSVDGEEGFVDAEAVTEQ